jgi:two-component system cell cycle response regulator
MTARVLIVDDLAPNVKLLEAKLANEYYEYASAYSGKEALEKVKTFKPDIILLDVMMPEMDGFEACKRLKSDPETSHIPVVMVTALSDISDRVQGLQSGADDFLTKPINEVHLFARIRSLTRVKLMLDELRLRDKTGSQFGLVEQATTENYDTKGARVFVVDDDVVESKQMKETLEANGFVVEFAKAEEAVAKAAGTPPDLIIVSTMLDNVDGLRLCVQVRSQEASRHVPLMIMVDIEDKALLIKGLEMGINDYIVSPLDANELIARSRTQIKRKRYQDALKSNYEESVSLAITDSLTKLYNRRYLDAHIQNIFVECMAKKMPLSVLSLDIDHFKSINDKPGWGHHIGDEVLKQFAQRILAGVRTTDLACRPGGEEFVILLPGADKDTAKAMAERVRASIADVPFPITAAPNHVQVTTSVGMASTGHGITSAADLLKKSDEALYAAKKTGRNKVVTAEELV